MTTERSTPPAANVPAGSADARLEALRRRRAAVSSTRPLANRVDLRRPARRRHPAAGARKIVVGLSASTAVVLLSVMARADSPGTSTTSTVSTHPSAREVVRPATEEPTAAAPPPVDDPPTVSPTKAAPVTTSQASPRP